MSFAFAEEVGEEIEVFFTDSAILNGSDRISGNFSRDYLDINGVATNRPAFITADGEFAQEDVVDIGDERFTVISVHNDHAGIMVLLLNKIE